MPGTTTCLSPGLWSAGVGPSRQGRAQQEVRHGWCPGGRQRSGQAAVHRRRRLGGRRYPAAPAAGGRGPGRSWTAPSFPTQSTHAVGGEPAGLRGVGDGRSAVVASQAGARGSPWSTAGCARPSAGSPRRTSNDRRSVARPRTGHPDQGQPGVGTPALNSGAAAPGCGQGADPASCRSSVRPAAF